MLGMMGMNANLPWANSAWKQWVDHITKQGHKYGFRRAALVYATGATAATSNSTFMLAPHEIKVGRYHDFFDTLRCQNCVRYSIIDTRVQSFVYAKTTDYTNISRKKIKIAKYRKLPRYQGITLQINHPVVSRYFDTLIV